MRYEAIALDYDGTLATDGKVDADTIAGLEQVKASGRRLLMVTGRELDSLYATFDRVDLFDLVVAENGGLLYRPADRKLMPLAHAPTPAFVSELTARGVKPISVGAVIVATWEPHEATVLGTIRDLGLELEVIFNKGAVMVLPSGVNKGTGLKAALKELGLSAAAVVGVGDAENDHSFLNLCGASAAVANALPALKARADIVTSRDHGAGVVEVIAHVLANDLVDVVRSPQAGAPIG